MIVGRGSDRFSTAVAVGRRTIFSAAASVRPGKSEYSEARLNGEKKIRLRSFSAPFDSGASFCRIGSALLIELRPFVPRTHL